MVSPLFFPNSNQLMQNSGTTYGNDGPHRTRVYIPWGDKCGTEIKCGTEVNGSRRNCAPSVSENSFVLFYEGENPLLRGGLAMATFALEYLNFPKLDEEGHFLGLNKESLRAAIRLFRYFEKSEWRDHNKQPTGFFLRSRRPGDSEAVFHASVDEILGMTLGLYYFNEALKGALNLNPEGGIYEEDYSSLPTSLSVIQNDLIQLVKRLGNYMKENYYFLVPPEGLPQELHTGWYGCYYFQWYLNEGFKAITGQSFDPGRLGTESDFWTRIMGFESEVCVGECPELSFWDKLRLLRSVIGTGASPEERAKLMIQGTGLGMANKSLFKYERFNFPLLLHAFQLGMLNVNNSNPDLVPDPDFVSTLKQKMAILIYGVLSQYHANDKVDFWKVILNLATFGGLPDKWVLDDILNYFIGLFPDLTVGVGTCEKEADLYAAAIAYKYDLPYYYKEYDCSNWKWQAACVPLSSFGGSVWTSALIFAACEATTLLLYPECDRFNCYGYENPEEEAVPDYWNLIYQAINQARLDLSGDLPVADLPVYKQEDPCNEVKHNPYSQLGKDFCWEQEPGKRVLLPYNPENPDSLYFAGLSSFDWECFCEKTKPKKDAMKEGGGLDFLFPTMLLYSGGPYWLTNPTLQIRDSGTRGLYASYSVMGDNNPYLSACAAMPGYIAEYTNKPPEQVFNKQCSTNYPENDKDVFEPNDSYSEAKELPLRQPTSGLTIDRYPSKNSAIYARYENSIASISRRAQDYDYYFVKNNSAWDIKVEVTISTSDKYAELYVDGEWGGNNSVYGNGLVNKIEAFKKGGFGRSKNYIMVKGEVSNYSLTVTPLVTAYGQYVKAEVLTPVNIVLRGSDPEGKALTFKVKSPPNGTLSGTPPNLTYTAYDLGADSFTFIVSNGLSDSIEAEVSIFINAPTPEVKIISPKSGDVWSAGNSYVIQWKDDFNLLGSQVNIEAQSSKAHSSYGCYAGYYGDSPVPNTGSFTCTISNTYQLNTADDYRIVMWGNQRAELFYSDCCFTIIGGGTLMLSKAGSGSGTITSNPSGINCGSDCSQQFSIGTFVTLTATPSSASVFSGWGGATCPGTGPCAVKMEGVKSVTANFGIPFTLTVSKNGTGSGTVTGPGVDCGNDCEEGYSPGSYVELRAQAASGSVFSGWSGACTGKSPCSVHMNESKSVAANFDIALTVAKAGTGKGTILSNPSGINCGLDCYKPYSINTKVKLTAQPGSDSVFSGWSGNPDCSDGEVTLNVSKTCVATFNRVGSWEARYNGPNNGDDHAAAIAVDANGYIYVTGTSEGDYLTIKYDADGNQLWEARYDGPGHSIEEARAIAVDSDGNVYVTGKSNFDYVTVKYDSNGNLVWVARYDGLDHGDDEPNALAIDIHGNVYVTGKSYGSGTNYDYATIKYDTNGHEVWVARYNGAGSSRVGIDIATGIALDSFGYVYVTGESSGGDILDLRTGDLYDYATIKYSPDGSLLWIARYDSPSGVAEDEAKAIAIDVNGNVYVTGSSSGIWATVKYDTNGNQLWVMKGGYGYGFPSAIAIDSLGNVLVTGYVYNETHGNYDYATVKYDPDGHLLWETLYNGPANNSDHAAAMALDVADNVYVTGWSMNGDNWDIATIKYDPHGNQVWEARYNGPANGDDFPAGIALDAYGNIYVAGSSMNANNYDYILIKYSAYPVFQLKGDIDGDGNVDQDDLDIILSRINKPASVCPSCDLDGDGMITALDARTLSTLCTRPNCATEPQSTK